MKGRETSDERRDTRDEIRTFESLRNRGEGVTREGVTRDGSYESIRFLSSSVGIKQDVWFLKKCFLFLAIRL